MCGAALALAVVRRQAPQVLPRPSLGPASHIEGDGIKTFPGTLACLIYLAKQAGLPWQVSETGRHFWGPWHLTSTSLPILTWGMGGGEGGSLWPSPAAHWSRGWALDCLVPGTSLKQHVAPAEHVAASGEWGGVPHAQRLGHVCTCPIVSRVARQLAGPVCVGGSQQQCHVLTPHSQAPPV